MNNLLLQRGYNGNKLLKKADTDIEWDVEKIEELYKCSQDPIYFAEKYIKIFTFLEKEINRIGS